MIEYELMYIVPTSFTDEEVGTVEQAVAGMLAKANTTVLKTTRLGKFRFAYPIKHEQHGHYVLVRFQAEPAAMASLNDAIRLSPDKVLRHLILRADEAGDEKFDLVQFQEVNVETRDDRGRKPRRTTREGDKPEEVKAAKVEAVEGEEAKPLTKEELDKKIDAALEEKA